MIPLRKTCPRFKRAATDSHGNLPPTILFHVGFFSLRFNFCGTTQPGYLIPGSMVSLDQDLRVLLHARQHNGNKTHKRKRKSYNDRVTSPKKSVKKTMKAELDLCIIAEAPPWLTLPRALAETLTLYPQKPEPVSNSEGTTIVGWPPREYSTVMVRFEPTTSCLHERILRLYVSIRQ